MQIPPVALTVSRGRPLVEYILKNPTHAPIDMGQGWEGRNDAAVFWCQGMNRQFFLTGLMLILGAMPGYGVLAQSIPIPSLAEAPSLDGDDGDWGKLPFTTVALRKTKPDGSVALESVSLKGGTYGDRVYFFIEWDDATMDAAHKPWVWNDQSRKYVTGPQREDRFAIQFAMSGDFTTDWRSGNEFKADTWHWKAFRSNPLGLAHDKSFAISRSKLLRAYKLETADGTHVYLSRPSDSGEKLYKTKRYRRLDQQSMPKYVLTGTPKGSVADVSARGVWSDGRWRLELTRKMRTGNRDDVEFPGMPGKVLGGIAVFDHSENDDHAISDTLTFEFLHQPWGSDQSASQ